MNKLLPVFLIIIVFVTGFSIYIYSRTINPICPEDFPNTDAGDDARLASFNAWTNEYYDAHPDATLTEWADARHQFHIEHKCTVALQKYEDAKAGNADPETMSVIDDVLNELIAENASTTENAPTFTEEEIYTNSFVTHVRTALNGYLDGTNSGIEDDIAISGFGDDESDTECGLSKFDSSYYKSKFIVWSADPGKYGGMQVYIVFVDKPDTIFWAYVFQYEGTDTYVLRGFCKSGPTEEQQAKFPDMIKAMLADGVFPYSL